MNRVLWVIVVVTFLLACFLFLQAGAESSGTPAKAATKAKLPKNLAGLNGPFDLAGERIPEVRYYLQETRVVHFGFDGKRTGMETYTVTLRCVPAVLSGKSGDEYMVGEFAVRIGPGEAEMIPELAGWSYVFPVDTPGLDERGQVFGIPHEKFMNLTTSRGGEIAGAGGYPIYNSFIDFHAFCDVLARPTAGGGGIQDLRTIGHEIVHASAFTAPPLNLGSGIKKGSVFRNGEVKLTLKGISIVDEAACAVVGYDSGENTLRMIVPMGIDRDIEIVGGSEYLGDIYIDLATRWVRKVRLDEFVVWETRLPSIEPAGTGQKIPQTHARHLLIRMINREEFERNQSIGK